MINNQSINQLNKIN